MKIRNLIMGIIVVSATIAFYSCSESDNGGDEGIAGTYFGTFTRSSSLKSAGTSGTPATDGFAEVSLMGDQQIQVHCSGDGIDTTFMLTYYENNDSVMVCLTGEDFDEMYGHMLGEGHMGGNMMGDIHDGETEWMHHLNDEHSPGDEHFGGFDMHNGTFTYAIGMTDESGNYYMKFQGSKK